MDVNQPQQDLFFQIKFYAVSVSATVLFLWALGKAVWHEFGLRRLFRRRRGARELP